MIFGIGTDLVELSRIKKIFDRFGDHFAQKLLMAEELESFYKNKNPIRFLGMRFAAKEAIVKAMGTGFSKDIWIKDVGINNLQSGKPITIFSDRGLKKLEKLDINDIQISLSDEAGLVMAFCIAIKN